MQSVAIRSVIYGFASTLGMLLVTIGLAFLSKLDTAFSYPYMAFVVSGAPLSSLLEMLPIYLEFRSRMFPEGGPGAGLTWLFIHAFITWTMLTTLFWWRRFSRKKSGT